jgi:hypothetical protein
MLPGSFSATRPNDDHLPFRGADTGNNGSLKRKRVANADSFPGIKLALAKRGVSGAPVRESG